HRHLHGRPRRQRALRRKHPHLLRLSARPRRSPSPRFTPVSERIRTPHRPRQQSQLPLRHRPLQAIPPPRPPRPVELSPAKLHSRSAPPRPPFPGHHLRSQQFIDNSPVGPAVSDFGLRYDDKHLPCPPPTLNRRSNHHRAVRWNTTAPPLTSPADNSASSSGSSSSTPSSSPP